MTTPPDETPVTPLSLATGIMLPDQVWHPLASSLGIVLAPAFLDPFTGAQIAPGDPWVQFVDVSTGQAFAAPFRSVIAVEIQGAVAINLMPELVAGALAHAPQHADKFPGHEGLAEQIAGKRA